MYFTLWSPKNYISASNPILENGDSGGTDDEDRNRKLQS